MRMTMFQSTALVSSCALFNIGPLYSTNSPSNVAQIGMFARKREMSRVGVARLLKETNTYVALSFVPHDSPTYLFFGPPAPAWMNFRGRIGAGLALRTPAIQGF
jgi:hypothetical protein